MKHICKQLWSLLTIRSRPFVVGQPVSTSSPPRPRRWTHRWRRPRRRSFGSIGDFLWKLGMDVSMKLGNIFSSSNFMVIFCSWEQIVRMNPCDWCDRTTAWSIMIYCALLYSCMQLGIDMWHLDTESWWDSRDTHGYPNCVSIVSNNQQPWSRKEKQSSQLGLDQEYGPTNNLSVCKCPFSISSTLCFKIVLIFTYVILQLKWSMCVFTANTHIDIYIYSLLGFSTLSTLHSISYTGQSLPYAGKGLGVFGLVGGRTVAWATGAVGCSRHTRRGHGRTVGALVASRSFSGFWWSEYSLWFDQVCHYCWNQVAKN